MSYCKISQSLKAASSAVKMPISLWNLAGTLAAVLPRCLPNFLSNWKTLYHLPPISHLWDFARSYNTPSYAILNRPSTACLYLLVYPVHWIYQSHWYYHMLFWHIFHTNVWQTCQRSKHAGTDMKYAGSANIFIHERDSTSLRSRQISKRSKIQQLPTMSQFL